MCSDGAFTARSKDSVLWLQDTHSKRRLCGFSHVIQRVLPAIVEDAPLPLSAFWRSRVELMTPTPLTGLDLGSNYQGLKASTLHLLTPMKSEKKNVFNASTKIFLSVKILKYFKK